MEKRPLRILIVDNSILAIEQLCIQLEKGGYVPDYVQVEGFEEFVDALNFSWDIIISESAFPNYDCFEGLAYCREKKLDIPFIVVSEQDNEELIVNCIKSGATDYISKANLHRLIPCIERELKLCELTISAKETNREDMLKKLAAFSFPMKELDREEIASHGNEANISVVLQDTVEIIKSMLPVQADIILKNNVSDLNIGVNHNHFQEIIMSLCVLTKPNSKKRTCIAIEVTQINNYKALCNACGETISGNYYMFSIFDNCYRNSSDILKKFRRKDLPKWSKEPSDLDTVSEMIHDYGGHLIMESIDENNMSFHVLLPNIGYEKSTHILVVDDDVPSTQFMSRVLKTKGFDVTSICDSSAALRHFRKNAAKYDLAFIDFYMPGLSGLELASALLSIRPDLAIVFCTAHLNVDERKSKSIGVSAVIYKPMRIKQILDLTECLLLTKHLNSGTLEKPVEKTH